eukprot:1161136-Pelagomonas_calceolata.AAC.2
MRAGVVNGMAAAGIPPDLYTAALRAVLVEWAALPGASLPARLQAADALCTIFGVHRDLHEQLLYRALSANEQVVPELFKQAQAIVHNRFGVARTDFSSKVEQKPGIKNALMADCTQINPCWYLSILAGQVDLVCPCMSSILLPLRTYVTAVHRSPSVCSVKKGHDGSNNRDQTFFLIPSSSSQAAYRAWRRAALAETLAALTALQQLPEFNALLEVRAVFGLIGDTREVRVESRDAPPQNTAA